VELLEAIDKRRAYRSLEPFDATEQIIHQLGAAASLAPSCYNKQPWRFVFVRDPVVLDRVRGALSRGNAWANRAPLIIAAVSTKDLACVVKTREYFLYDLGTAVGFLLLRATDLGLVAHPIAGYDEEKTKEILGIPAEMTVITLIIVGKKSETTSPELSEAQRKSEEERPARLLFDEIVFVDRYGGE
jgi:nitroreductase